ncbi:putative ABC-type xenobiotic transporter [Helianthus anomalus]
MSSERCKSSKSCLICSSHVSLGLPLPLLPSTVRVSTTLTGAVVCLRFTCSNHLNLPSLILSDTLATPNLFLKTSFLIRSNLVIAIARALIKSPRILLLDEATSALDSKSERFVQEALDHATVDRTTIVIAHLVEFGSHDDLIQLDDDFYASLVQLQETKQIDESPSPYLPRLSSMSLAFDVHNISNSGQAMVSQLGFTTLVNSSGRDNFTLRANQEFQVMPFKKILALNSLEWKQALVGSLCAILFGTIQPTFSFSLGSMISVYFLADHDEIKHKTMIYTLCFAGLSVLSMVINVIQHYNFVAMGEYLTKRVRERMLSKILTFEIGWFDQDENSSGAICSRLATDANMVRSLVGDRCSLMIQTFSAVMVACTMGLVTAWQLALVVIVVQPLMIFSYYSKQVMLKNMSQKALKSQEESSKLASEAVSNLRIITVFSSEMRIIKMLLGTQKAPMHESIRQAWYAGFVLGFSQSLMGCTWALSFWYGGKLISNGHLGPKDFFQAFLILINTGKVIADAGTMTNDLSKGFDGVKSVFNVLDRNTLIDPEDHDGKKPEVITGHIFNGFSISIEAGKSTALVGQSGSGKSTIIGLIERFYDPMEGVVKVDGRDIKLYHLRTLRKFIALVSQESTLFTSTIRENIIYGVSKEVSEVDIVMAAKAANAHDFISVLKDGYDTWCGNQGVQLSGGQKQRIAIARAILKNPKILLLDEATSALDSQSEKAVQDALERMMVGQTSVIVAHRLSTIQSCDTIVVLKRGMVVEKGNHGSLLAKGPPGAYYSLVNPRELNTTHHTLD